MQLTLGSHRGFTLLEVLITLIVLAIGLLGLANLQSKMQVAQVESYQRAQAVLLLEDMVSRINANRGQAAAYATGGAIGTGDAQPAICAEATSAAQDLCEWSNALKGASEANAGANAGAMIDGRGCVQEEQAPNLALCTPGVYRVTVAWQGLNPTVVPALSCAENSYGANDALRRVVSLRTVIGLPAC